MLYFEKCKRWSHGEAGCAGTACGCAAPSRSSPCDGCPGPAVGFGCCRLDRADLLALPADVVPLMQGLPLLQVSHDLSLPDGADLGSCVHCSRL